MREQIKQLRADAAAMRESAYRAERNEIMQAELAAARRLEAKADAMESELVATLRAAMEAA